jgi:hypothetical protein
MTWCSIRIISPLTSKLKLETSTSARPKGSLLLPTQQFAPVTVFVGAGAGFQTFGVPILSVSDEFQDSLFRILSNVSKLNLLEPIRINDN